MVNNVLVQNVIQQKNWFVQHMETQKHANVHRVIGFSLIIRNVVCEFLIEKKKKHIFLKFIINVNVHQIG
jgi:hypothetical protein